jgi:predicted RNase H-like HicB family nuclease
MIDNAQNYEHMILGSEDDSKWIVYVPELAGCMADGDTSTQALENVERVIED